MSNQFRNTSPQKHYSYVRQPQLAHQNSIPVDTIIKGVHGLSTRNYSQNTPIAPQTTQIKEIPQKVLLQQHSPIKRFDQPIQMETGRPNIIQRQRIMPTISSRQQLTAPLPPERRVEYIPYQQRYVEYVQQKVRVPVQKLMTDYYQVEHIIEYVPVEKADIVYVTQPQQVVDMKLQYVPVQQRIIHIKQQDAKKYGINQQHVNQYHLQQQKINAAPIYHTFGATQPQSPSYVQMKNQILSKSRTNYVTCQGYDPNQKLNEINKVLAASAVRQSRVKKAVQQNNSGQQILTNVVSGFSNMKKKQSIYDMIGGGFTEVGKREGGSIKNSTVK